MKTEKEMLDFITRNVSTQGNEGAINISPLLIAMVQKLFKDPTTGITPMVVTIAPEGVKVGTRTTYEITTAQPIIDEYIDEAYADTENTRLFVQDNAVLIGFPILEVSDTTITGKAVSNDGEYGVVLSKTPGHSQFYHEAVIEAIPEVTRGEIDGYKELYDATYNKDEKKFDVVVGATQFALTPGEMMLVNEEYNKKSTDGVYTGMWAYSKAKYICCAPWFKGFAAFKLHSAFLDCRNVIIIDLHTDKLPVADMTNAFAGCSRLEQISGVMEVTRMSLLTNMFTGCFTLFAFQIHGLASNLDLSDCPQISFGTFEDLIKNASSSDSFTITVNETTKNNIDNNSAWLDVKNMLSQKTNISIAVRV